MYIYIYVSMYVCSRCRLAGGNCRRLYDSHKFGRGGLRRQLAGQLRFYNY